MGNDPRFLSRVAKFVDNFLRAADHAARRTASRALASRSSSACTGSRTSDFVTRPIRSMRMPRAARALSRAPNSTPIRLSPATRSPVRTLTGLLWLRTGWVLASCPYSSPAAGVDPPPDRLGLSLPGGGGTLVGFPDSVEAVTGVVGEPRVDGVDG